MNKEFVIGRGLDNLACCFCSLEGFLTAEKLEEEQNVRYAHISIMNNTNHHHHYHYHYHYHYHHHYHYQLE